MEYKYFAEIRIKGKFNAKGWYPTESVDFVDICISKEEAERMIQFLISSLEKEKLEKADA